MRFRWFGPGVSGAVALVEPPVSRSFARKARAAFFVAGVPAGLVAGASLWSSVHAVLAVLGGVLVGAVAGVVVAVLVRAWPVLRAVWHWSVEIVAVWLGWLVAGWLVRHALLVLLVVVAAGLPVSVVGRLRRPALRWVRRVCRSVVSWVWCAVVRHRLRLCFAEFLRATQRVSPGCLPLILLARPTPAGERVWVWLRPGLDLSDLDGKTGKLAVACWAGQVRVVRASARFAALVRVDVARRDPLTVRVDSPLPGLVPEPKHPVASPGPAVLALDLPDVPEEFPPPRAAGRR